MHPSSSMVGNIKLYILGNFSCFCCRLLTQLFQKNSFRNTISVSKSFDLTEPDLGQNCLQRISADDKLPLERVKSLQIGGIHQIIKKLPTTGQNTF